MSNKMTLPELIKEYEDMLGMELTERDKIIFNYAYMVGSQGWDTEED